MTVLNIIKELDIKKNKCYYNNVNKCLTEGVNVMEDVINLIAMIFDTIKRYLFLILGRADELEKDETAEEEK